MSASKKKKVNSKNVPANTERRPKTLGVVLLVAAGASSWYWYKPLPPETSTSGYSDWRPSGDDGLWSSTDLIRPSLENFDAAQSLPEDGSVEGLIGHATPTLVPVPQYRRNLNDMVAQESMPTLPTVAPPLPEDNAAQVANSLNKPWTNEPEVVNYDWTKQSNSRPLDWPDASYQPDLQQRSASKPTMPEQAPNGSPSGFPALLPASNVQGHRSIQTLDREPPNSFSSNQQFPNQRNAYNDGYLSPSILRDEALGQPTNPFGTASGFEPGSHEQAPRKTHVIRQPRPNAGTN